VTAEQKAGRPDTSRRRRSSEEKNAEVRASLEPLAPGQRPKAVTVATIVALVLAIGNVVAFILGDDPKPSEQGRAVSQLLVGTGILGLCAYGMWRAKYWGVLGFQTLLAIQMLVSVLALLRANSLPAVLIWLALLTGGMTLFWFLIRAMARIQMPEPPESQALRDARAQREAESGDAADAEQQEEAAEPSGEDSHKPAKDREATGE
jgi:hypothetical protein